MNTRMKSYEGQIQREVHRKAEVRLIEGGAIEVSIPCTLCKDPPVYHGNRMLPADTLGAKLRNSGWHLGRHPTCPKHCKTSHSPNNGHINKHDKHDKHDNELQDIPQISDESPKIDKPSPITLSPITPPPITPSAVKPEPDNPIPAKPSSIVKELTTPTKEKEVIMTTKLVVSPSSDKPLLTAVPPTPTADVRAAKREAVAWLDQSFDIEAGRFRDDINDATIAKDTGLSEAKVKEMREELYGPIKEPREVAEIKAEIERLKETLTASNKTMTSTLDRLANQQKEVNAKFEKDLAALTEKYNRVASSNNWD